MARDGVVCGRRGPKAMLSFLVSELPYLLLRQERRLLVLLVELELGAGAGHERVRSNLGRGDRTRARGRVEQPLDGRHGRRDVGVVGAEGLPCAPI